MVAIWSLERICYKMEKPQNHCGSRVFRGASDLTRTGDLLITSEMHYRLCYTSNYELTYYSCNFLKSQLLFACYFGFCRETGITIKSIDTTKDDCPKGNTRFVPIKLWIFNPQKGTEERIKKKTSRNSRGFSSGGAGGI